MLRPCRFGSLGRGGSRRLGFRPFSRRSCRSRGRSRFYLGGSLNTGSLSLGLCLRPCSGSYGGLGGATLLLLAYQTKCTVKRRGYAAARGDRVLCLCVHTVDDAVW